MEYIKDIPSMGCTCRAYLICTLRKNFAVIFTYMYATCCEPFQTTAERISLHKKPAYFLKIAYFYKTHIMLNEYVSAIQGRGASETGPKSTASRQFKGVQKETKSEE